MIFNRTYHAMDLLQEINDVVRSNLNYEVSQVQSQQSEILISGDIQLLAKGLRRDCLKGRDPRFLLQPALQVICVRVVKYTH